MTCPDCGTVLEAEDYNVEENEAEGSDWFVCRFCGAFLYPVEDDTPARAIGRGGEGVMQRTWTQEQFARIQRIARRHDIRCPLRVAMVTGDDLGGTRVCNCEGKVNLHGEPKTTPRERTLDDALKEIGNDAEGARAEFHGAQSTEGK